MRTSRSLVAVAVVAATVVLSAGPAAAAAPSNDTSPNATVVGALPASFSEDTTQATTDAEDAALNADCGAPATNASVWFAVTAPSDGGLVADGSLTAGFEPGFIVATGSPGSLSQIACGPTAVAWPTSANETYYVMAFDDGSVGPGTGGILDVTFDVAPPPPTISATVDPRGYVDKQGNAVLSGTLTCSGGDYAEIDGQLSQNVGRFRINGYFYVEGSCDGSTQPWTATVYGDNGRFAGGKSATVAFAYSCGIFFCSEYDFQQTVKLRGMRR